MRSINIHKTAGILGILAFLVFSVSLLVFGFLNQDFKFFDDFISKLGAIGEPNALGWNLIGFLVVGGIFLGFGIMYGKVINDRLVGILLSLFGLGFAFTAIPIDMIDDRSPVSKAHIVAICLGLACWLFGLARMGYNPHLGKTVKLRANIAAGILGISMIGFALGLWSMPITHRLVFGVVFGWTVLTSIDLLKARKAE